jgi:hypothetical protein
VQVLDEKNVVTCEVIEGNEMSSVKFLRVSGYGPARHAILAVLTGRHGMKIGPQGHAWAEGQARPMRHDDPTPTGPCRPDGVPCRAVPARWPSIFAA